MKSQENTKSGTKQAAKIGFASLGCPKALVDSERIITQLRAEGYELSHSYDGADLVIVNTCGFIDSARDESLETIGDALNENGKVIVTGCLGARPEVIRKKYPNVLAITGPQAYESVISAVHEALPPVHDRRQARREYGAERWRRWRPERHRRRRPHQLGVHHDALLLQLLVVVGVRLQAARQER